MPKPTEDHLLAAVACSNCNWSITKAWVHAWTGRHDHIPLEDAVQVLK